ncbi:DivIVA domain-containing protein [Adhaeribacter aquaticus]|uniref:DivIVA domain-containing protein n=1 Tax=Adhaeribacter aquaticus TaxID=299567 RepID=UPI00047E1776|nr:DivIVA domain-containing protein [Adhaeribacter aquaticus]
MKITPLEIRQKTFEKAFRGLDKDEVSAFLLTLSQQWEKLLDENKDLRTKLDVTSKEVQKMKEVESTLYRTLKTAEDTGNSMLEQASKEATLQVREAQLKSEQLLNDARLKARAIIEDAYGQSEKAIAEMHSEVKDLELEHQRLESYVDNLLRDLRNLATDALDKVEKNAAKQRPSLSSILAKAANIKVKRAELDKVFQDVPSAVTSNSDPVINKNIGNLLIDRPVFKNEIDPIQPIQPIEPVQPIQPFQPEVPSPVTPVPNPVGPEIEQPKPDIPEIAPDRIETPSPDIQPVTPNNPEIQPQVPQPAPAPAQHKPVRELASASSSFFDDFE